MFSLMAIFGVKAPVPCSEASVKIVTSSHRGEDRIIFGKTNT
jgi:hypothetical protein